MQMGTGAAKSNVSVQYCMTFARMVLQTAEIPAVTTFRASDDYGPGQTGYYPTQKNASLPPTDGSTGCGFPYCVYYVGTTSILAWGMDLGPSKVRVSPTCSRACSSCWVVFMPVPPSLPI